jgi:hypothetical protein
MEKSVHAIESQDLPGANVALQELVPMTLKSIRNELEIRD